MGNRGILHDERQQIVRPYQHRAWIICRLSFKGRRRAIMSPGRYTELFFLDEATALAAGHRPCYECRREKAHAFRDAWAAGNPERIASSPVKMSQIDTALHQDRLTKAYRLKDRRQQTYMGRLEELPDGAFILWHDEPHLVWGKQVFLWAIDGYHTPSLVWLARLWWC